MNGYKEPLDDVLDENETVVEMEVKDLKKSKKKEEKTYFTAYFEGLIDVVNNNGNPKFLTNDGKILNEIQLRKQIYYPPEKLGWLLPKAENVLEEAKHHSDLSDTPVSPGGCTYCEKVLYPYIYEYFKQFSDTPTDYHRHFLVWMDFHSYLIEKFNFSPILFLVATKDRGKTPTLKAIAYSAYRGVFTETFREANLIRYSSDYRASMFFDVRDFPKKIERAGSEDLVYGRAERGVKSSRVLFPERGAFRDMVEFETFGVTGATSNVMVDAITEARCIVFNMPFSKRVFDIESTPELGLQVREKLTAFRMAHLKDKFIDIKKEKIGKLENYLKGYHQMIRTIFPKYEEIFIRFKKLVEKQKREEAESTFEGKLLSSVVKLNDSVTPGTLFLSSEDITNKMNEGKPERFYFNIDTIGSGLKGLGFKMKRDSLGSKRGILYDIDLITTLGNQFNIDTSVLKEVHQRGEAEASEEELNLEAKQDIFDIAKEIF